MRLKAAEFVANGEGPELRRLLGQALFGQACLGKYGIIDLSSAECFQRELTVQTLQLIFV